MQRWKATLAYDGTPYHGWQIQPTHPTVQGALAASILHITGESTLPQGSGRTDTGVHALAQVAHFDLTCNIPPENLQRALNRSLPQSIRVLALSHCAPDFHARHSAQRKTYEYRILPRPRDHETICAPFLAPYLWPCPYPLSLHLLNQAAVHILGTHDFTSFAAVNPDQATRQASTATASATRPSPFGYSLSEPPPLSGLNSSSTCTLPAFHQEVSSSRNTETFSCRMSNESCSDSAPLSSFRREADGFAVANWSSLNTRTIHASSWIFDEEADPAILRYRVTGSGFLHHMVRNLVGTFVECGADRLDPEQIPHILARLNRQAAGPTAPPYGLFLAEVEY